MFTGSALTLHAVAYYGAACSFKSWYVQGYGFVTTNPLDVSSYPGTSEIRGEFICSR